MEGLIVRIDRLEGQTGDIAARDSAQPSWIHSGPGALEPGIPAILLVTMWHLTLNM